MMSFCPTLSLRMCELSSKHTFTPLFRADNAEPLTNILNLPLKIHLAFVSTSEILVVETVCCLLQPLFLFIWPTQTSTESCMSGDGDGVLCILQEEFKDYPVDYNLSVE